MLALLQPPNLTRFACLLAVDFTGRAAALQALPPASRQAGGRQNPVDLDRPSVRCVRGCAWCACGHAVAENCCGDLELGPGNKLKLRQTCVSVARTYIVILLSSYGRK
jgi:hypothetical protein